MSRDELVARVQQSEQELEQLRQQREELEKQIERAQELDIVPRYVNQGQLSEILGVHYKSLWRWRDRGEGPPWFKLANEVCYPVDQLLEWFEDRMHEGGELPATLRQLSEQEAA
jgi:hypothetical protein